MQKQQMNMVNAVPNPVGIYMLKLNNRNTSTRFEIHSKLTIKTQD